MDENMNYEEFRNFVNAAMEATKNCNSAQFECPLCGAKAIAVKTATDGHIHAICKRCNANFVQ